METAELVERTGSLVDPLCLYRYYFDNPERHSEDAPFKADHFTRLLRRVIAAEPLPVRDQFVR